MSISKHVAIVSILALAGCVTPQTLRGNGAVFDLYSAKSVSDISACIGSSWANVATGPVNTVPIEGGVSFISLTSNTGVQYVIDITDAGNQRRAQVYVKKALLHFEDSKVVESKVKGCL